MPRRYYLRDFESLSRPFQVATRITISVGGYTFHDVQSSFTVGPQHRVSGRVGLTRGQFFDGRRSGVTYSGRVELSSFLMLEPAVSVNGVALPYGSFTDTVARTRAIYAISPRSFVSALVRYSSVTHAVTANARWRWDCRPGSDVFVVFSEGRGTEHRGTAALQSRGVVAKLTKLLRF